MPKPIREILKAAGYTDEELKSMDQLLTNPKFSDALNKEFTALETQLSEKDKEIEKKQGIIDTDTKWYNDTCVPETEKMMSDLAEERAKRVAAESKIETYQKQGLIKVADQQAKDKGGDPDNKGSNANNANTGNDNGNGNR